MVEAIDGNGERLHYAPLESVLRGGRPDLDSVPDGFQVPAPVWKAVAQFTVDNNPSLVTLSRHPQGSAQTDWLVRVGDSGFIDQGSLQHVLISNKLSRTESAPTAMDAALVLGQDISKAGFMYVTTGFGREPRVATLLFPTTGAEAYPLPDARNSAARRRAAAAVIARDPAFSSGGGIPWLQKHGVAVYRGPVGGELHIVRPKLPPQKI